MRFDIDLSADAEQTGEGAVADKIRGAESAHRGHGSVDAADHSVGRGGDEPARRLVEERIIVSARCGAGHQRTKSAMALIVAAGALRFGQ